MANNGPLRPAHEYDYAVEIPEVDVDHSGYFIIFDFYGNELRLSHPIAGECLEVNVVDGKDTVTTDRLLFGGGQGFAALPLRPPGEDWIHKEAEETADVWVRPSSCAQVYRLEQLEANLLEGE